MKILFMGTPDFALFSLKALAERSGHEIVGAFTQPDQPKGRGYVLTPPPVKVYAAEKGIPVYQPTTLKSDESFELLKSLEPDVIVVAAYGKILPARVLEFPRHGCLNIHGSLLPKYRGAAPMQRAIIDGERETGITIMQMDVGLDTGDMLLKETVEILPEDNFEDIHDKLGACGAELILTAIERLEKGTLTAEKQDESLATYAKKIEKSDCLLDFSLSAEKLHNLIRGLSPIPLAFTHTPDGKLLKILSAKVSDLPHNALPGTVLSLDGGMITVACGEGAISLLSVLPEGKGRMTAAAYINGRRISIGDRLQ
jgi:methionyl-tRNA formyltransferase